MEMTTVPIADVQEFTSRQLWQQGEDILERLSRVDDRLDTVQLLLGSVVEFTDNLAKLLAMIPPEMLQMAQMQMQAAVRR